MLRCEDEDVKVAKGLEPRGGKSTCCCSGVCVSTKIRRDGALSKKLGPEAEPGRITKLRSDLSKGVGIADEEETRT